MYPKKIGNLRTFLVCVIVFGTLFLRSDLLAQNEDENTNPDYFVEAFVSNPMPYIGEQIIYTLRFYAFILDEDIELTYDLPPFEGFWITGFTSSDIRVETVNDTQYNVGEIFVEITPLESERFTISPSTFNIDTQSVFLSDGQFTTNSVELVALPLPEPVPDTFNGAVGQMSIGSEIDSREVTLGEPLRLTVDIQGTGNFELLRAPELMLPEDVWQVISSAPKPPQYSQGIAGVQFGQRIFEWLIIPRQTGSLEIPPITFTYFDPQQGFFVDSATPAYPVNVFPGSSNQERLGDLAESLDTRAPLPLKAVDPAGNSRSLSSFLIPLLWIVPPVLAAIGSVWVFQHAYMQRRGERKRFNLAYTLAANRLDRLKSEKNIMTVTERVPQIIRAYLADKMSEKRQSLELQPENLHRHNVPEPMARDLFATISTVEAARYAPAHTQISLLNEIAQIRDLLGKIDAVWSNSIESS